MVYGLFVDSLWFRKVCGVFSLFPMSRSVPSAVIICPSLIGLTWSFNLPFLVNVFPLVSVSSLCYPECCVPAFLVCLPLLLVNLAWFFFLFFLSPFELSWIVQTYTMVLTLACLRQVSVDCFANNFTEPAVCAFGSITPPFIVSLALGITVTEGKLFREQV